MSRKTVIVLEDDLTGELLPDGAGETVSFSVDGDAYQIDLSAENAKGLRQALSDYTRAGRKVSWGARRKAAASAPKKDTGSGRTDLAQVREWAQASGHTVSERGRVAGAVLDAYDAAH